LRVNDELAVALHGKNSAQPAYDQTALELCNVCGWKTLIPDDVCLNCEYEKNAAQPAPDEEKNT
jgi:hypothetical protein